MATNRSPELDQVRRLLFPNLTAADGWAQIDRAFSGAADPNRVRAIEECASEIVLLEGLKELETELDTH